MGVRSDRREGGALHVELAIVVLLLLVLVTSVVEIGRYLAVWHSVTTAAQSSADQADPTRAHEGDNSPHTNCSEIKWAAVTSADLAELGPADVEVNYEDVTGRRIHACTEANVDPATDILTDGSRVVVTVTRRIELLTPVIRRLIALPSVTSRQYRPVDGRPATG